MPLLGGGEFSPPSDIEDIELLDDEMVSLSTVIDLINFIESKPEFKATERFFNQIGIPASNVPQLKLIVEQGFIQEGVNVKRILKSYTTSICAEYLKFRGCEVNYYPNNLNNARFVISDYPPFIVIIESKEKNITGLRDMQIGKLLFTKNIPGIKQLEKRGRNRLAIEFDNPNNANAFLDSDMDIINGWRTFIPSHLISCKAIIRNIDPYLAEEDIKEVLTTDNGSKVLGVKRLRRRVISEDEKSQSSNVNYVNTASIVVTFSGSSLPKRVSIYYSFRYPELYIQPVVQCHKCLRYGHTSKMCQGKQRCPACAQEHSISNCSDKDHPSCIFCKGNHFSSEAGTPVSNRTCVEFLKQKKIKEIMAVYNLSNFEAVQLISENQKTNNPLIRLNDNHSFPSIGDTEKSFFRNPNSLNNYNKATSSPPKRNFKFTKHVHKESIVNTPKRRNELPSELLFFPNGQLPDSYNKRTCTSQTSFDTVPLENNVTHLPLPSSDNRSQGDTLEHNIKGTSTSHKALIAGTHTNNAYHKSSNPIS